MSPLKVTDRLAQLEAAHDPFYSFEYFPPKTELGVSNLCGRLARMSLMKPAFVSITWPASGSDNAAAISSLDLCEAATVDHDLLSCCHLTCTNMSPNTVDVALAQAKALGLRNILALRGDPPRDASERTAPTDASFRHAVDLVRYIRAHHGDYFCIGVAAYPEAHPDSATAEDDLDHLKTKIDAGADFIITQLFYDEVKFVEWFRMVKNAGVTIPIFAGIMPIQGYATFRRLIHLTKVSVPPHVHEALELIKHDDAAVKDFGVQHAVFLMKRLSAAGVRGFHISTLNLERSVRIILETLSYVPAEVGKIKAKNETGDGICDYKRY